MKIGIYNESSRGGAAFDGSKRFVASLALALAEGGGNQVEFVHHTPHLSHEHLSRFLGRPLEGVALRHVDYEPPQATGRNPARRLAQARSWHAGLSQPYDLFVNVAHDIPPFCHAPRGVLVVLFPYFNPSYIWPEKAEPLLEDLSPLKRAERSYHAWEWKQRMDSYSLKLSISEYVRVWTRRRWGIESQVLYPSGESLFQDRPKENLILSVGRFSVQGVPKRQLETTLAFAQMQGQAPSEPHSTASSTWEANGLELKRLPPGWKYVCAGAIGTLPEEKVYFENVRALGAPWRAHPVSNLDWVGLKEHYERAKIFWHAAGYGVDDNRSPGGVEHFGIVTVEAMAAGCVPVVINAGGQSEIVQHGVNGFLWSTLEELRGYTALLAHNEELREQMSRAARLRAREFSAQALNERFVRMVRPLLSRGPGSST